MTSPFRLLIALLIVAAMALPAAAQDASAPAASATPPAVQDDDPDRDPNDAQPDFYVATLNTNLRLPKGKWNFRLTHRFLRTMGEGDFGDLAARLFGLDGGAQIGLDLKYGLARGLDVGIYRTSDRTIQLQGRYNLMKDGNGPIGVGLVANVDGTDNFSDEFSPGFAVVLSRELGDRGAIYFQPSYVGNIEPDVNDTDDDYTVLAGSARGCASRRNCYLFVEGSPRVSGFDSGVELISFGFEQRYGGHVFQLNFSNGFATTLGAGGARRHGQR